MTDISRIDLNLLKSLQALLDERHVGRAAQRMNVSQSAMSQTLARLRNAFGDPLFVRTARGLSPTARAQALSPRLKLILNEIGALLADEQLDLARLQRRFCIHTHEFIAASYLAPVLARLSAEAPGLVTEIKLLNPHSYRQLEEGEVDLIVSAGLKATGRLMQQRYRDEQLVCLLAADHPVLEQWRTDTLFRYPHITSPLLEAQDDPIAACGKRLGLPPRQIGAIVETLSLQPAMIPGTRMLAFLPLSLARSGERSFNLVSRPLPFDLPPLTIRGLWHEREQGDPAHRWVRGRIHRALTDEGATGEGFNSPE